MGHAAVEGRAAAALAHSAADAAATVEQIAAAPIVLATAPQPLIERHVVIANDPPAEATSPSDALPPMPNPMPMDLVDPMFNAIWNATKTWDVNVPAHYVGYCGMNGSHVMLILNALRAAGLPRANKVEA